MYGMFVLWIFEVVNHRVGKEILNNGDLVGIGWKKKEEFGI